MSETGRTCMHGKLTRHQSVKTRHMQAQLHAPIRMTMTDRIGCQLK